MPHVVDEVGAAEDRSPVAGRWWPLGVLAVTALLAGVFFSLPAGGLSQTLLFVVVAFAAPTLLAIRLSRERRSAARPWLILLVGAGLYALATPFWGLLPVVTGRPLPFPSPLDALYFTSYTLSATFLVMLLRLRHRHADDGSRAAMIALLEAGIFAIAMTALLIPGLILPNLADPGIGPLSQAVAVGYPLATAVLFGLTARLAIASRWWTPELGLLLLWAGGELAGDTFYGYLSAAGDFAYGHPISAAWLLSYVALGGLALHPRLLHLSSGDRRISVHDTSLWLPVGAVMLPLVLGLFQETALLEVVGIIGVVLLVARLRLMSGDLDEQRRLSAEISELSRRFEHQSLHDGLTGLANRNLFGEQLERSWAQQQRHGRGLVVLMIDLDGFKQVNDRFGHHVGDALLVEAARRMADSVRGGDTLARLSGDEFAAILPDAGWPEARVVAERILDRLTTPVLIEDRRHTIGASIGIAEADPRQPDAEGLLREADTAMYAAKAAGRGTHVAYAPGIEHGATVTFREVVPEDARAWADYVRALRHEIAHRPTSDDAGPSIQAPHVVRRTLERVLVAIEQADLEPTEGQLSLPLSPTELEEIVFHLAAVRQWADSLVDRGLLTVPRSAEADRFWAVLERRVISSSDT